MKMLSTVCSKNTFIAATVLSLFTLPLPGRTLPANEVSRIYYSDATKTEVVGESTLLCNGGRYSWGRTTRFYKQESFPCVSAPSRGGSKLPCEFTAQTAEDIGICRYIPQERL